MRYVANNIIDSSFARYNNARKISFIPFPFVHSQLSAIYAVLVLVVVPVMIISYVKNVSIGAILNTFTVLCFGGLHEGKS